MKIKYLRKAPKGMPGDIAEVPDLQANILIKLKFAESVDAETLIELLKNANGTLVVDDFGSLVESLPKDMSLKVDVQELAQDIQPIKPKQKRVSKTK